MLVTQKRDRALLAITLLIATFFPGIGFCESPVLSKEVVARFVEAYNNHDVEQMLENCSDDVRWLTVAGDAIAVEADGKPKLRSAMKSHFEQSPNTRSTLLAVEGDGPMVVAIEKAMSGNNESARSQCSASVYQLKDGLIESVWYFNVYRCGEAD